MSAKLKTKTDFSAGGIVWDNKKKKVMLIHVLNLAREKVWTFPKGHPEKNETPEAAALREVEEETGWECRIEKSLLDVHYVYTHNNVRINKSVRWFEMTPLKKKGDFMQDEVLDCRWMTLKQAQQAVVYQSDRKILSHLNNRRDDAVL